MNKLLLALTATLLLNTAWALDPHAPAAGSPHGGFAGPKVEITKVAVPKAQGPDARTVAELYAKSAQLKDKPVLLRGTVVKVTMAVMGKNWVHLRDGTGSGKDNTDDIIATTTEKAEPGSVVVVKGVVHTDVDLGSGYAYKVLIENATLQK
jgi:uncharacterized protein YdeI (BOF family)